jgi:hypothetical protein
VGSDIDPHDSLLVTQIADIFTILFAIKAIFAASNPHLYAKKMKAPMNSKSLQDEIKSFRDRWEAEFKNVGTLHKQGASKNLGWEGGKVYADLSRNDHLNLVLPIEGMEEIFYKPLTSRLARECYLYRLFSKSQKITESNHSFRDGLALMKQVQKQLKRPSIEESPVRNRVLRGIEKLRLEVQKISDSFQMELESYAEKELVAPIEERTRWNVTVEKGRITTTEPEEIVRWEKIFNRYRYKKKLYKDSQLDTRLQVRVGVILRSYLVREYPEHLNTYAHLGGISRETIVRLTLLTYIAAGLAEDKEGELIISRTGYRLTRPGVLQVQQRAGLK